VQHFRSKIDGWFVVAAVVVTVLGGAGVTQAVVTRNLQMALVCALPVAMFAWIVLTTRYTLTDEALDIRCAFLRTSIPLASIRRLRPTRSPLSSTALSLDRIEVHHDTGMVMISPRERERFVQAIRARCPTVDVQGV
jgi:hypothetical protein